MLSRADLARQLRDLADHVDELTDARLVGVLEELKAGIMFATMTAAASRSTPPDDEMLTDVAVVARIVRRSSSWVRKHGCRLPGFRQPGGKGTRVAWSRLALEAWATTPSA